MVVNRYIIIEKKDEVYLTIDAESDIRRELSEFFTFEVPGYKFMPQYRNRYWDGKIRLFKYAKGEIYYGLLPYVKKFCEDNNIQVIKYCQYIYKTSHKFNRYWQISVTYC